MSKFSRTKYMMIVGAAVAALVSVGAAPATAEATDVRTTADLSYKAKKDVFKGWVDFRGNDLASPDQGLCVESRKVELFKQRKGRDKSFGAIRTNELGAFKGRLTGGANSGTYYVEVHRKSFTDGYGDLVTCKGARSNKVTVH